MFVHAIQMWVVWSGGHISFAWKVFVVRGLQFARLSCAVIVWLGGDDKLLLAAFAHEWASETGLVEPLRLPTQSGVQRPTFRKLQ